MSVEVFGTFVEAMKGRAPAGTPWANAVGTLVPGASRQATHLEAATGEMLPWISILSIRREIAALGFGLDRWCDAFDAAPSRHAERWAPWVQGWRGLCHGQPLSDSVLEGAFRTAQAAGDSVLVVELAALRALTALADGAVDRGVQWARRGARMARTESILLSELLASWVLARARRLSGCPHLSRHIIRAVAPLLPAGWRPLWGVEAALSGSRQGSVGLSFRLDEWQRGNIRAHSLLGEDVARFRFLTQELDGLAGLVDKDAAPTAIAPSRFFGMVPDDSPYPCVVRYDGLQ
ncbi:MAG: hypothetical protein AAGF12_31955, partial [Myxococcota bacterium]